MGYIADIYSPEITTPTLTDRYHFTTLMGYWIEGRLRNPGIAYIYGRKEAEGGGYTVSAEQEGIIDILKRWKEHGLNDDDRNWMEREGYPRPFIEELNALVQEPDSIQADACKTKLFFPQEPLMRFSGPIAIFKMAESINLCIANGQDAHASHGVRMAEVLEQDMESGAPKGLASVQGLRRGPSLGSALESSRGLSYGGYKSTSTGRAAEMQGTKFAGTMDHAWVMTHKYQMNREPGAPEMADLFRMRKEGRSDELKNVLWKDAFRSFAFIVPNGDVNLTDTHDTLEGIEDAITVIKELRAAREEFPELELGKNCGMRFDSGKLVEFSKIALRRLAERNEHGDLLDALPDGIDLSQITHRQLLDYAAKSSDAPFCSASDGIDVYTAQEMRRDGAYIKTWGVGTAGSHVPPLGLVQKMSAFYMEPLDGKPMPDGAKLTPMMKIVSAAPAKSSNPGNINSRRFYGEDGKLSHVVIFDEDLGFDPQQEIVDLRDFSKKKTNPGGATFEDTLAPVWDAQGRFVYKEPPQKPLYPGSDHMVTDLDAVQREIKAELETLPASVRRIERPRAEVLCKVLTQAFDKAKTDAQDTLTLNIADIEALLPPPQAHIPVYLDRKLYEQRVEFEQTHLADYKPDQGVGTFTERFEAR